MWSGHVAFGLVHIPVKMFAATEDRDVSFHQVHLADGGRISYQRVCRTCEQVVPYAEIGKAYEDDAGRRVIVTEEELAGLKVSHGRDIEIVEFVRAEQIDPIHFDRAYYLQPVQGAEKPYVLLRQALQRTDRAAVAMVTIRTRTRLALVRVREDVLVLQTLLWPDEVRSPDFGGVSDADVSLRSQESAMADSLVEGLSADFDPTAHHDTYREAILELVTTKLAGQDVIAPEAQTPEPGVVVDLMAALQESVRRTREARTAGTEQDASLGAPSVAPAPPPLPSPRTPPKPARKARSASSTK
jgi:DNA end-binding protein Ku